GEAELAHGAVQRSGARVHLEDGENVAVALEEGDIEGGGDVVHVELAIDLAPEVEEDERLLDLLRGRALKARRRLLRRLRYLAPDGHALGAGLPRAHPHGQGREGLTPAFALALLRGGGATGAGEREQKNEGGEPRARAPREPAENRHACEE